MKKRTRLTLVFSSIPTEKSQNFFLVPFFFCHSGFQQLEEQLSEAECIQYCSMSSFPYVQFDPDNLVLVRSNINNFFNFQVRATERGTAVPKPGFMFTINTTQLEILLKDFK